MKKYSEITTGQDADEGSISWYRKMFLACEPLPEKQKQLDQTIELITSGLAKYLLVAKRLKAKNPLDFAWILGVVHFKEGSCNFKGVLHNGEKIVGTDKKTTIVPIGRGPFQFWDDAAVDAIKMNPKRWQKLIDGSNDISEILYALERYNGTGYIVGAGKAETSPYLWSCSNVNDGFGKYVADGKFDPMAKTGSTCGAALILKKLWIDKKLTLTV